MTELPPTLVVAETAMGFAGVALGERGIVRATLLHRTRAACAAELAAHGAVPRDDERAADVAARLQAYASGAGAVLDDYPVDVPAGATDLQRRTWLALRKVPYGETRSYGWLAGVVGEPGKARVIGAINGANPMPLWLPCHRIIAANGDLQGFAGGLAMKRDLLVLEGALPRPFAMG